MDIVFLFFKSLKKQQNTAINIFHNSTPISWIFFIYKTRFIFILGKCIPISIRHLQQRLQVRQIRLHSREPDSSQAPPDRVDQREFTPLLWHPRQVSDSERHRADQCPLSNRVQSIVEPAILLGTSTARSTKAQHLHMLSASRHSRASFQASQQTGQVAIQIAASVQRPERSAQGRVVVPEHGTNGYRFWRYQAELIFVEHFFD